MKLKNRKRIDPKQLLMEKRKCCDKLHDDLEKQGVVFFNTKEDETLNIDGDYLSLPQNITEVSNKDLGEYLNAFTQQKVYMRTLVGYTELLCEEARREYYMVSDKRYKELLNSKLSETAKERDINSNPDVVPYYDNYVDYKNKLRLLSMNILSIEDIIFMLSREVSRRTGDFKEENRNINVETYGGKRR